MDGQHGRVVFDRLTVSHDDLILLEVDFPGAQTTTPCHCEPASNLSRPINRDCPEEKRRFHLEDIILLKSVQLIYIG